MRCDEIIRIRRLIQFLLTNFASPHIALSCSFLISSAGVSLDDRNIQGFLSETVDPHFRQTGMVLLVKITMSNKRPWEFDQTPRADIRVEVLPAAWGYEGSSVQWINYPYLQWREDVTAVQIKFMIEGSLGNFDWFFLILQIMAAAFMLRIAQAAVDFVGLYFIRDRVAFEAAKYGTLELNRQRTGRRHDRLSRQRTTETNVKLIRLSSYQPDTYNIDGDKDEHDIQQKLSPTDTDATGGGDVGIPTRRPTMNRKSTHPLEAFDSPANMIHSIKIASLPSNSPPSPSPQPNQPLLKTPSLSPPSPSPSSSSPSDPAVSPSHQQSLPGEVELLHSTYSTRAETL